MQPSASEPVIVQAGDFQSLLDALLTRGYRLLGPTIQEDAIVYEEIASVAELPAGWADEQDGGVYRLKRRSDAAFFGYSVGPRSWKQFLYPPTLRLWQAQSKEGRVQFEWEQTETPSKMAFVGVRPCEMHAIAIQDRVLMGGNYSDSVYAARRANLFVVVVQCGQAGGTCFCASMQTGPRAASGFDLALTEIADKYAHYFLVEIGSERGAEVLRDVPTVPATEEQTQRAEALSARAARQMGRTLDTTNLKERLYRNYEHPHWDEIATRCLTCGNCTMVCPTCFCMTVEDVSDLTGTRAERRRRWDSCFQMDFSYISGGSVRYSSAARYRQWMTHKLATWIDQFGTSGCVGCGRCITWCPVGIDITAEARVFSG
jgi:ferredoxin